MKKLFILSLLIALIVKAQFAAAGQTLYSIKDYGARGDGKTLDTKAINNAIDAAAKAGGGTVYVPAGEYLSGSIHLQSNISLYLEQGATITATTGENNGEYDAPETPANKTYQDYGHTYFHNSFIWGENLHDISILGPGKLWGKGLLRDYKKDSKLGNKTIALYKCRNVIIRDITIQHGGWFGLLITGTDNLTIDNIKEDTNRDGMDVDCCKNVRISNCFVNSPYDDGICLKSTFALGYARSTDNVTITNCQVSGYDEGTLLDGTYKRDDTAKFPNHPIGRIKFGTESNGGFKNITVSNCVFDYCSGLALETVDGALLEDVAISNITMRDIVTDPIFMRLGARMRGPANTPIGELRRVMISNVVVYNANPHFACTISGLPGHDIEDVQLNNIRIYYKGAVADGNPERDMPEKANGYPEPGMFGQAPAYGFFIRHAKNIKMNNVQVSLLEADNRPAFRVDDVQGLYLNQVSAQKSNYDKLILLKDVTGVQAFQSLDIK